MVGNDSSGLKLFVLDSTDPIQIKSIHKRLILAKTLFLVSSKSGSTLETLSLMEYFWSEMEKIQPGEAHQHFIAITDPGSKLESIAKERLFREIILADPTVGGRFSALTVFGMVPASLSGIDIEEFLEHAENTKQKCSLPTHPYRNPGLLLGIILAEGLNQNKNKLTFITDPDVDAFGVWAEQLIAESSGKNGTGILPIVQEPQFDIENYAQDRLFVYLRNTGKFDKFTTELSDLGLPVITYPLHQFTNLAEWFYVWEIAVSVACSQIQINAFDQPNVQDSKIRTNKKVEHLRAGVKLPMGQPIFQNEHLQLYWTNCPKKISFNALDEYFKEFISTVQPGDYFAINAFLPETPETRASLQQIRQSVSTEKQVAATIGFGPRYLHSTGQFHKGGPNNGYFLMITHDCQNDLLCPVLNIQFCDLIKAQALGDLEALEAKNRQILHIHLPDLKDLKYLTNRIA
jgi:transaldolase/glucose-6-phosphate isomerase